MRDDAVRRAGANEMKAAARPKRILVAVTGHGFGHLAQVASLVRPILNAQGNVRLTIRSPIPAHLINRYFSAPIEYIPCQDDFGVRTDDGVGIDVAATRNAYMQLHEHWKAATTAAIAEFDIVRPDLVLSNAGHIVLAAAQRCGIPGWVVGSLDWHTILSAYEGLSDAPFLDDILKVYCCAQGMLRLAPGHTKVPWRETIDLGVAAAEGENRRSEMLHQLGVAQDARVVLCAFGGGASPTTCP